MTETAIVPINMSSTLTHPKYILELPEATVYAIASAFPGQDLTDVDRAKRCLTHLHQYKLWIETSQKQQGALLGCVLESHAECALSLASMDLPLIRSLSYAALIPYSGVCTVTLMYQGLGELMQRAGTIGSIQTGAVYEGDTFDYELGSEPWLKHRPGGENADDRLTHTWCVIHNLKGPQSIEVMDRDELAKVRRASKSPDSPAWKNWFSQMCRKAPMRRLAKFMHTAVGGMAQTTLARGLDLENSQYDVERMGHYKTVREEHSRKVLGEANADLDGPAAPPKALPALKPATDLSGAKKQLLATVMKARKDISNDLTDGKFIVLLVQAEYGRDKLQSVAECKQIEAVLDNYNVRTGKKVAG